MFKTWEELTPLEQAASEYSDLFKAVNGFRPRNMTTEWTLDDYETAFISLDEDANQLFEQEKEAYEQAIILFENTVAGMIELGANNREDAIRWIIDAFDEYDKAYIEADPHYFCFEMRLPTNYDWRNGKLIESEVV